MKEIIRSKRRRTTGMTLIEILVCLGLVASVLLGLVVIFGSSLNTVERSKAESVSTFIADGIRAKLLTEPDWPPGVEKESFSRAVNDHGIPVDTFVFEDLYFDADGVEIDKSKTTPIFQGVLTFSRSAAYQSRRLDFIRIEIKPLTSIKKEPITFSFQRALTKPRPAS